MSCVLPLSSVWLKLLDINFAKVRALRARYSALLFHTDLCATWKSIAMPKQLDNFMHSFFAESHIMSIIVQSKSLLCCFGYESTHLWKSPENVASDWSIDQCHIWWRKRLRNFWAVSRLKLASKELGSIVKLTLTKCWADWWRFGSRNLDQLCYFHSDCSTNFGLASICSCRTAELSLTSCVKC